MRSDSLLQSAAVPIVGMLTRWLQTRGAAVTSA